MVKLGLFVRLQAKPGKEAELGRFLKQGYELANQEGTTPVWFAVQFGPATFAIFDAFDDEPGRQAHLNGRIAAALMSKAPELLAEAPRIEKFDVVGAKLPSS
jgi:quinol monooxygenase YgiN